MMHKQSRTQGQSASPPHFFRFYRRSDETGFGLIELIVALTVFSVLVGGLMLSLGTGLALARSNRERSVGANLAAKEIDAVRQSVFTTLVLGLTTTTAAVDGVNFTVDRNLEWVGNASTAGECESSSTAPKVLRVTVDVSWTDMKTVQPVRASTELSPPVGSYDPTMGHIAVKVSDSDAKPLGNVPVRVQGPGVDRTLNTTDAYAASPGCAFFGFLTPGAYSVSLGSAGYVDRQGISTPTQAVGVNPAQVASVAFDYDRASTLAITLAGAFGGTPVNAMPVTLGNTGYIPSARKVFAGTGATRNLTNLFPYNDGYDAWGGDCADADPEGKDTSSVPYWPTALRADSFEVNPAATTSGAITVGTLQVDFNQSGAADGTDTIIAVHGSDALCSAGETLTLTTFPSNTGTALIALPYGTWSIRAQGKTPSGSWPTAVVSPLATGPVVAAVNI